MRRKSFRRRELLPDAKFGDRLVARFINAIIWRGKKSCAEAIVYQALETAGKAVGGKDPLEVLKKAVENVRPLVEVKPRRVGGATYQVPVEVREHRGETLAVRWIRDFARKRKGGAMEKKLAEEIAEAYKGQGSAVKKKEDTHKMAEANKAFSHYRW